MLFERAERGFHLLRGVFGLFVLRQVFFVNALFQFSDAGGALGLARRQFTLAELAAEALAELFNKGIDRRRRRKRLGAKTRFLTQFLYQVHDLDHMLVGEENGREHLVLGHLPSETLDHRDGGARAGDDQIEIALFQLRMRRQQDQLTADAADPDRASRSEKRDLREVQRGAGADHAKDVRIVLPVGRQGAGHDLDFVDVARGEERADGPVDQARSEDFLSSWPTFTLDEAAGELARGVSFLTVIDGERKKILARSHPALYGGRERHGVAEGNDGGAVGLLGELAGFENEVLRAERAFHTN